MTQDTATSKKKTANEKKNTSEKKTKTKKAQGRTYSIQTMDDAFIHELSDMLNAEKQLTKALPKMAKAASSPKLAKAFENHLEETEEQIELINQAVELAEIKLKREKCDAMEGLIKEGKEIIENVEEGDVRDAMLIAAAQKVEHYEIAGYGTLVAMADQLGMSEVADILEEILDQEKATDRKLNNLAEQEINQNAAENRKDSRDRDEDRYSRSNHDDNRYYSRSRDDNQYDDRSRRSGYNDNRYSRDRNDDYRRSNYR